MAKKPRTKEQRVPNDILDALREARAAATLKTASFAFPDDTVIATRHMKDDFRGHPNDYIKDTVGNHHATWIIGPLDKAIRWAEGN